MGKLFYCVEIEIYEDGTVKAAILLSREATSKPSDIYKLEPSREIFKLWFTSAIEAGCAVIEALAMNMVQEVAA